MSRIRKNNQLILSYTSTLSHTKIVPCICPIISGLSNRSVPASNSSFPARLARNFEERSLNHSTSVFLHSIMNLPTTVSFSRGQSAISIPHSPRQEVQERWLVHFPYSVSSEMMNAIVRLPLTCGRILVGRRGRFAYFAAHPLRNLLRRQWRTDIISRARVS